MTEMKNSSKSRNIRIFFSLFVTTISLFSSLHFVQRVLSIYQFFFVCIYKVYNMLIMIECHKIEWEKDVPILRSYQARNIHFEQTQREQKKRERKREIQKSNRTN